MKYFDYGEIVLYKEQKWVQYVEDTAEGIRLYDGLNYFFCDDDEIEKAGLPLGLDGLGFKYMINQKTGKENWRYRNFTVDMINDKYFIGKSEVIYISEVQSTFHLYKLIPFSVLERRMFDHKKS
ncbi:hypothetical protein [Mucilaginibacter sp. HD30]